MYVGVCAYACDSMPILKGTEYSRIYLLFKPPNLSRISLFKPANLSVKYNLTLVIHYLSKFTISEIFYFSYTIKINHKSNEKH